MNNVDKPQVVSEINTKGIVRGHGLINSPRTQRDPPIQSIHIKSIIIILHNNINRIADVVISPELALHVLDVYLRGEEARRVIGYILDHPAFLVPSMGHELAISKQTVYQILHDLHPWVMKSDKTLEHPGRGPGPRPHVWLIEGQDLVEGVEEARRAYYEVLSHTDSTVKRLEAKKGQLNEAVTIAKSYMDAREIKTIPDKGILTALLKEEGINVNYGHLAELLVKEGYKW